MTLFTAVAFAYPLQREKHRKRVQLKSNVAKIEIAYLLLGGKIEGSYFVRDAAFSKHEGRVSKDCFQVLLGHRVRVRVDAEGQDPGRG